MENELDEIVINLYKVCLKSLNIKFIKAKIYILSLHSNVICKHQPHILAYIHILCLSICFYDLKQCAWYDCTFFHWICLHATPFTIQIFMFTIIKYSCISYDKTIEIDLDLIDSR